MCCVWFILYILFFFWLIKKAQQRNLCLWKRGQRAGGKNCQNESWWSWWCWCKKAGEDQSTPHNDIHFSVTQPYGPCFLNYGLLCTNQEEVLEETNQMIPDCRTRFEQAFQSLQEQVVCQALLTLILINAQRALSEIGCREEDLRVDHLNLFDFFFLKKGYSGRLIWGRKHQREQRVASRHSVSRAAFLRVSMSTSNANHRINTLDYCLPRNLFNL